MWVRRNKAGLGALAVLAVAAGLWAFLAGVSALAQSKPLVSDIRAADSGDKTRIVLALDRSVSFTVFPLADPYRVVIDLPEVGWQLPPQPLPANVGLIEKLRYGLFQPGTTRVVLDMKGPIAIDKAFWLEADQAGRHRLVVDIAATSRDAMIAGLRQGTVAVGAGTRAEAPRAASAPRDHGGVLARAGALTPPPASSPPASVPSLGSTPAIPVAAGDDVGEDGQVSAGTSAAALAIPLQSRPDAAAPAESAAAPFGAPPAKPQSRRPRGKRVVVIDPGHGGPDPGTIGVSGTYEKHITLAMAKELKEHLEKTGAIRFC